ncbi:Mss4-like protein [Xylariales sp. PMI_506]|nr:Mss4-like protein [Xylariales sp. PMI_506]
MVDQADTKTYRGNCHCAAYIYEITLPEIKKASACNCTICYRKGALWLFPGKGNLTFIKGDIDSLSSYTFNQKLFHHKLIRAACANGTQFCQTCGTAVMCSGYMEAPKPGEEKDPEIGVNARTLQNLDIWSLEINKFDGASVPSTFVTPKFDGPLPEADLPDSVIVTGGCHCGGVRVAVKTLPLGKDSSVRSIDCNCSICSRYGAIWFYPKTEFVSIQGTENLSEYSMGKGISLKGFCKICGVPIQNKSIDSLSEEQKAALGPETLNWTKVARLSRGINMRIIDEVNVDEVEKYQFDGWSKIEPVYVNP